MAHADEKIFLWLNGFAGQFPLIDQIIGWVVSDYLIPICLSLTLIGLWFSGSNMLTRQKYQIGLFVALSSMSLSSLIVLIINQIYFRPRPFVDHDITLLFYQPTDSSFPANSIAATFGISVSVWCVNKRVGTVMLIASTLYGFARVYAGIHYPMDIVSGALIAAVVTFLVLKLRDLLEPIPTCVLRVARIFCLA